MHSTWERGPSYPTAPDPGAESSSLQSDGLGAKPVPPSPGWGPQLRYLASPGSASSLSSGSHFTGFSENRNTAITREKHLARRRACASGSRSFHFCSPSRAAELEFPPASVRGPAHVLGLVSSYPVLIAWDRKPWLSRRGILQPGRPRSKPASCSRRPRLSAQTPASLAEPGHAPKGKHPPPTSWGPSKVHPGPQPWPAMSQGTSQAWGAHMRTPTPSWRCGLPHGWPVPSTRQEAGRWRGESSPGDLGLNPGLAVPSSAALTLDQRGLL